MFQTNFAKKKGQIRGKNVCFFKKPFKRGKPFKKGATWQLWVGCTSWPGGSPGEPGGEGEGGHPTHRLHIHYLGTTVVHNFRWFILGAELYLGRAEQGEEPGD